MQKSSDNTEDGISEVNVIPLADVTLVLLIMIMVLSPMSLQSMIQIQAAQAVASKSRDAIREKPVFVDITTKGFTVNSRLIPTEYELFRTLQKLMSFKKDKTVLISSAPNVKYENVVRVLDVVKQSGAVSLSLVPRKQEAP